MEADELSAALNTSRAPGMIGRVAKDLACFEMEEPHGAEGDGRLVFRPQVLYAQSKP
jgi:hypothetical protein